MVEEELSNEEYLRRNPQFIWEKIIKEVHGEDKGRGHIYSKLIPLLRDLPPTDAWYQVWMLHSELPLMGNRTPNLQKIAMIAAMERSRVVPLPERDMTVGERGEYPYVTPRCTLDPTILSSL
jgi:hypothetical protein